MTDQIELEKMISEVIMELSSISEENAACMQEASASVTNQEASINDVSQTSDTVNDLSRKLKVEIDKFILA